MPSFSRKRASASLDALSSPPTRAQRAISRLSRLRIPSLRPSLPPPVGHRNALASQPPPPPPSHGLARPTKLRRKSRSLSTSTTLDSLFSHTPTSPTSPPLADTTVDHPLKKTISYPILRHASSPVDSTNHWWGVRDATKRLEQRTSGTWSTLGSKKRTPTPSWAGSFSSYLTGGPAGGAGGGATMSTSAGSYDNDPFASYRLGHSRTDAVDLDVHLESLSQDHRAQPTTYTPSISGYGDEDDTDSYGTRLTSHFSFSTFASATPSVPAHSPTDDNDDRDFALYSRDSTVSQDVELDFESSYQTPCLRSPPPSPTAYKNQPAVVSSRPLTPASPSFPFPSMLRKPSHAWSSGADDVEYDEADEEEEGGFSFARTKPKLPTPPSTPRLEPVVEAGGMSMLELEEEQVAEVEESKPSQISLFLEELSGKLVNLATADRPEMDSSSAAMAIQHKGSKTNLAIWPGADPRRSSIPFPTTAYPAWPFDLCPSPASPDLFSPPVTPPLQQAPPAAFTFPSSSSFTNPRHSASFSHFSSVDAPIAGPAKKRERVLRRVTGRINLSSVHFTFATSSSSTPPSPPDSPVDVREEADDFDVQTPTKGRFFATPPPSFLPPSRTRNNDNDDVELDYEALTPTPATPSFVAAFPSPLTPSPQQGQGGAILLPSAIVALEAVAAREQRRREEEGWTLLAVEGTDGERRRSF